MDVEYNKELFFLRNFRDLGTKRLFRLRFILEEGGIFAGKGYFWPVILDNMIRQ